MSILTYEARQKIRRSIKSCERPSQVCSVLRWIENISMEEWLREDFRIECAKKITKLLERHKWV